MENPRLAVKSEVKDDSDIDMDNIAASSQMDEDLYEDAGDLDFAQAQPATFLTRLPKYLWKFLSTTKGDQEGKVGTIRLDGTLDHPRRLSLMLYEDRGAEDPVPLEYNLEVIQNDSINTFVFTEQDLPGFQKRHKAFAGSVQDKQSLPHSQAMPRLQNNDKFRPGANKVDKNQRYQGNFRRAIPKKTAISGKAKCEIGCRPVENDRFRRVMRIRDEKAKQRAAETQVLTGPSTFAGGAVGGPGSSSTQDFIKPTGPQRSNKQDSKATRMPWNDLLDAIFKRFQRFRYWPFKALNQELHQPEQYLKEALEAVGTLVRQGPHNNCWQINNHYENVRKEELDKAVDAEAPEVVIKTDEIL